ncbi:alpha/beta hydrolase [Streptomyces phaeofaciens JCM 4814]|uniref:Alpha/beta hydrolase n=1 Tax=Streptomyces phaeofaciens TaxID=68254 RepID=A0A918H149_9ACTN|nr:alpha/beta fold hydrolase [Streptomyces phaeofaciens]GGT30430.1 alpha/beta hydrolase [Streptomyces phaeofaciens]
MRTGVLDIDGTGLYHEVRGSGPALLMISGAGGDAGYYTDVAEDLADAFTVITYDRRGNSRSGGRDDGPAPLDRQAADARALIDGLAGGRALVFGNSAGALIGLTLAARHPAAVAGLIAHEPPAVNVLPDGDPAHGFFPELAALYASGGGPAAGRRFAETTRGEGTYRWPADVWRRFLANQDHLFGTEWAAFAAFRPDEKALRAATFPVLLAAGAEDRGTYYARPSHEIARRIGAPWAEFPGIHMEFLRTPARFAAALRVAATQMCRETPRRWEGGPRTP